jgi:hypothetical protein
MSATTTPTPKRGGIHPVYGAPFVGGSDMDANYNLTNADVQCISQLRTIKQLQNIQTALEQVRDNVAAVKFHGNLEVDDLKATTELDKANFIEKVDSLMHSHGFQTFFFMKGTDGKMYSLLTHSHLFTLADVIQEHRNRASPHVTILDDDGAETSASKIASHSKYDSYERLDCNLSRLAVQSVIGKTLQDDIKTRYSHLSDFRQFPGNVYFMMALEASNASVALDIDDALDKFNGLSLTSYPGENIKSFATEALRLIKVMEGGYCLPLRLGSDLLKKVYSTSCEHFNRWIHAKLDEVRDLELLYKLKDPKLMAGDPKYATLGPIALCGFLQEKYGSLVTEKAWPALSASVPEGNNASIDTSNGSERRCFHCLATDHLRDTCPKLGRNANRRNGGRSGKGNDVNPDTTPKSDTAPPLLFVLPFQHGVISSQQTSPVLSSLETILINGAASVAVVLLGSKDSSRLLTVLLNILTKRFPFPVRRLIMPRLLPFFLSLMTPWQLMTFPMTKCWCSLVRGVPRLLTKKILLSRV